MCYAIRGEEGGVDVLDSNGATPLMRCMSYGTPDMASTLIRHGANVNATDDNGQTPLAKAVVGTCIKMIPVLAKAGANMDQIVPMWPYQTELTYYNNQRSAQMKRGEKNIAPFVKTFDAGPDPTVLAWACQPLLHEMIPHLLRHGCNPRIAQPLKWNRLHLMAYDNDAAGITELLQSATIDPYSKDVRDYTALHIAIECNHTDALKALIAGGADVNTASTDRHPLLQHAINCDNIDAVNLLLEAGLLFEKHVTIGSPLSQCIQLGRHHMASALIRAGALMIEHVDGRVNDHTLDVIHKGYLTMFESFISHRVGSRTQLCSSYLKEAISRDRASFVEYILSIDDHVLDNPEVVMYAMRARRADLLKLLLEHGADPTHHSLNNFKNWYEWSKPSSGYNTDIARCMYVLLDAGADLNEMVRLTSNDTLAVLRRTVEQVTLKRSASNYVPACIPSTPDSIRQARRVLRLKYAPKPAVVFVMLANRCKKISEKSSEQDIDDAFGTLRVFPPEILGLIAKHAMGNQ